MNLMPLKFRPGINRDSTDFSNEGGWWDMDKVRFRNGFPEKIGGWQKGNNNQFLGSCRALFNWTALDNTDIIAVGTHLKYYLEAGGTYNDITPIRRTVNPMGNNPFATTSGLTTVTVTDAGHGALENDFVTFSGATGFNGVPAGDFNIEHQIIAPVTINDYTIQVATAATGTGAGGGAAVVAEYQINTGLDSTLYGTGWGAGTWGRGTWGSAASTTAAGEQLRLWSQDNFGEDLIFAVRNGGIYYWDKTLGFGARGVALDTLSGSADAPTVAVEIATSDADRHIVAFGTNEIGDSTQDPMLIRWGNAEDAADWSQTTETTAGSLRLIHGSGIITTAQTRQEILVWTDIAIYSFRFVGPPYTFGVELLDYTTNLMGPNAKTQVNNFVFWMGANNFYMYDGRVRTIPCTVRDYVFTDLNAAQSAKVYCSTNYLFDEVIWFYPSADSEENDRYVIYNYMQDIWYFGTLARTAWIDFTTRLAPIAAGTDHYLYAHEVGQNDGSFSTVTGIDAYIESSFYDLDDGYKFMFMKRLIPDLTFRNSVSAMPTGTITLKTRNLPGSSVTTDTTQNVVQSVSLPVEQFTTQLWTRLRARSVNFRMESSDADVTWRLGTPRIEVRADGRK